MATPLITGADRVPVKPVPEKESATVPLLQLVATTLLIQVVDTEKPFMAMPWVGETGCVVKYNFVGVLHVCCVALIWKLSIRNVPVPDAPLASTLK